MPIEIICKYCGTKFLRKPYEKNTAKYCSKSCQARANISGKNKKEPINLTCHYCSNQYQVVPYRKNTSKYCSVQCRNKANAEKNKVKFKGINNPQYKNGIQIYRDIANSSFLRFCMKCGTLSNLQVHHKDFNRQNNHIENLEFLCRKCHQELHGRSRDPITGRFLWKKK